jgi:hypothetical protein
VEPVAVPYSLTPLARADFTLVGGHVLQRVLLTVRCPKAASVSGTSLREGAARRVGPPARTEVLHAPETGSPLVLRQRAPFGSSGALKNRSLASREHGRA